MALATSLTNLAAKAVSAATSTASGVAVRPASWRGVPFAVLTCEVQGGRRIALHQYPGRDDAWAEDMGQAATRYRLRGFITDNDKKLKTTSIAIMRNLLITACSQKGAGSLIHPTRGTVQVALLRWSVGEGLDAGNTSSVDLEFVESGTQTYPTISTTNTASQSAASKLKTALLNSAISTISTLAAGGSISTSSLLASATGLLGVAGVRADLVASIGGWSAKVIALAQDATALNRLTAVLPAPIGMSYGRFSAGANTGLTGSNSSSYASSTTVADLVSAASVQRTTVSEAADAFDAAATNTDLSEADDIATTAIALVDALAAACADPADAIRLMLDLIATTLSGKSTSTTQAVADMVIRAAAAALVNASASYQPQSSDDAAARANQLSSILGALMLSAADAGDDDAYGALRDARGAVVTDLRSRGASLAQLKTFAFGRNLPAIVLAQQIYGDATRVDQLMTQTGAPNPLFMPTSFEALAQ